MAGLNDYITDKTTVSTQLPSWFGTAQESAVNQALNATSPAIQDTAAQSAVSAFGSGSPFTSAQTTLQSIGTGAANPWLVSETGQVTPNTTTALGGLFSAQQDYFNKIMPDIAAQEDAGAIAGGGFGSKMNQAGVAREIGKAYSDLVQKQQQAALQNQQTGVAAGTAQGNVANQMIQSALNTGTYQQNAPYAAALNLQNILQKSKLPEDKVTSTDKGLLNQLGALGSLFSGGLDALSDRKVINPVTGKMETIPGLLSKAGVQGGLSGLISKAGNIFGGSPAAQPNVSGQMPTWESEGYSFYQQPDGSTITIDPSGNYYQDGNLIWTPGNSGDLINDNFDNFDTGVDTGIDEYLNSLPNTPTEYSPY